MEATRSTETATQQEQEETSSVPIVRTFSEFTLEGVKQFYIDVQREEIKMDVLVDLYPVFSAATCIVYCSTRNKALSVVEDLAKLGLAAMFLPSDLPSNERSGILKDLENGAVRMLVVAGSIVSRSELHDKLPLVVNYDLPTEPVEYLARLGCSTCYGCKSVAVNFATSEELAMIRELENKYYTDIKEMPADIELYL